MRSGRCTTPHVGLLPVHPGLLPHRHVAGGGLLGVVAALALTVLGTGMAEAFFPTNLRTLGGIQGHSHEAITTDALEALDAELFGAAQPTDSMRAANDAIVDANVHVDDDQGHSALHFDGENFFAGQGRLLTIKGTVIASIQQNDTQGARNELGQALHSIQDFYAHSNWTNNNGSVNPDLGVTDHQLQNTLGINDPAEVNGQLTNWMLRSGFAMEAMKLDSGEPVLTPLMMSDVIRCAMRFSRKSFRVAACSWPEALWYRSSLNLPFSSR